MGYKRLATFRISHAGTRQHVATFSDVSTAEEALKLHHRALYLTTEDFRREAYSHLDVEEVTAELVGVFAEIDRRHIAQQWLFGDSGDCVVHDLDSCMRDRTGARTAYLLDPERKTWTRIVRVVDDFGESAGADTESPVEATRVPYGIRVTATAELGLDPDRELV